MIAEIMRFEIWTNCRPSFAEQIFNFHSFFSNKLHKIWQKSQSTQNSVQLMYFVEYSNIHNGRFYIANINQFSFAKYRMFYLWFYIGTTWLNLQKIAAFVRFLYAWYLKQWDYYWAIKIHFDKIIISVVIICGNSV